MEMPKYFVEQ